MNLYEISNDIKQLAEYYAMDLDDIVKKQIDEAEARLVEKFQHKGESIVNYIRMLKQDIDFVKSEKKRLESMQKITENKVKKLQNFLLDCLNKTGKEINTPTCKCKKKKLPNKVEILSEELIPETYINTEIVRKIDKKAIKEAIDKGEEIDGAVMIYNREGLNIK